MSGVGCFISGGKEKITLSAYSKKEDMTKVYDFWAPWCAPCRIMNPIIEELETELPDVEFVKVNFDEQPELAEEHGVMSIPTYIIFKDDKEVDRIVGALSKPQLKLAIV